MSAIFLILEYNLTGYEKYCRDSGDISFGDCLSGNCTSFRIYLK